MEIKNTQNVHQNKVCLCVYGPSGVGKTSLVGTLPGKVLMLSAEQGELSLKGKDIDYVHASSWKGIDDFIKYTGTPECQQTYDWIVIDSISEVADRCIEGCEKKYEGFKMWGAFADAMSKLIKYFRDNPHYNSLHIYQEEIKDDDMGRRNHDFCIKGSLRSKIPYFYDIVLAMRSKTKEGKTERFLQTVSSGGFTAKDRSGSLEQIEQPDLENIYKKIIS